MGRGKQLNIYVPADKIEAVDGLRRLSEHTGKPINWLVVDAITQYVNKESPSNADFRSFELKVKSRVRRDEIYEEQLERKLDHR
jgi:hypothetical protein